MTRTRSIVGKRSQEGEHDRHRDVVGQVGDEGRRVGARELRDRAARRPRRGAACRRSPAGASRTVCSRAPASRGSTSTAVTCLTTGSSARVSEPRPGPTSTTTSCGPDPGDADDLAHRVGVDDEVLAPLLGRSHLEPLGELAHLGRPEEGGVVDVRRGVLLRHALTLWPRPKAIRPEAGDAAVTPQGGRICSFESGASQVRSGQPALPLRRAVVGVDAVRDGDLLLARGEVGARGELRHRRSRARSRSGTAGRRSSRCRC